MINTVTSPWDPAQHLNTEEDMAAYLEAALEENDPNLVAAALGVEVLGGIPRSRNSLDHIKFLQISGEYFGLTNVVTL